MTPVDGRLIIRNQRIETAENLVSENPATLEAVGKASLASTDLCEQAIRAAKEAFPAWRWLDPREKKAIFKRAENILARRASEAGRLIAMEKGSPYAESLAAEVFGSLQSLNYYAENQGRLLRPRRVGHHTPLFFNKTGAFHFHPLGPTLIISPWNFPFLIPLCDILSALTAGNTVVLRPSTTTPLTALLLGEVFVEAGLPPGVLNVVPCRVAQAEAMIVDHDIQSVMFTGSVGVGKRIMELCSRNLTNLTLELGGKDPMIVLRDADLERAARGAVWTAFMNCGQSCGAIERAYVAREVAEPFIARVIELAKQIRVGNPLEPGVDMGPMATAGQLKVVEEHIADARARGARIPVGGKRVAGLSGHFIEPTVLTGVDHTMLVMAEETFGPTLPIMVFDHPDEALALANDSVYGLTASVWTRDRKQAAWFAERLEAGSVTVNDHMYSFGEPRAIWGGIKQTGMGRSHGPFGLHELVNIKYVGLDFFRKKSQTWWFPYDRSLEGMMEKAIAVFHGAGLGARVKAALGLRKEWRRIVATAPLWNYVRALPRILKK
ncbi:MAG: aldehyde dehydrogenase family protein [Candidatus Aminicenantes bacterium]|nr:aldehyde dehydrogenase family protein [Candidatus Aminicenantes bacterium]